MANSFKPIVGIGSRLGNFQTACDVIGMTEIPIVSQAADLISCGISLATGDYVGAALSVGGLIPGVGQATGAAKLARGSVKMVGKAQDIAKTGKIVESGDPFLSLTMKGKGVDLTNVPKNTGIAKKSEINAKPASKQSAKEIEDFPVQSIQPEVGSKFDTGSTNPPEGINISETIRPSVNQKVQSSNYDKFIESVESGKQFNNPTGVMPRTNLWPNLW